MKKAPLVCQYLENVSRELLSEYRDVIQRYIRRRNGIYALFRGSHLP